MYICERIKYCRAEIIR